MTMQNLTNLSSLMQRATKQVSEASSNLTVLTVPIGEVVNKNQFRKKMRNIKELAQTMLSVGQQSPVVVSPKNAEGKYVIRQGERRWRALLEAKIPTINIIVLGDDVDEETAVFGELIENIQREDLTPLEVAHAVRSLVEDNGHTVEEVAEKIGKSQNYVYQHLSLCKLPAPILEVAEGDDYEVDAESLVNLGKLYKLNPERCLEICSSIPGKGGISRAETRRLVAEAKGREPKADPKPPVQPVEAPTQTEGKVSAQQQSETQELVDSQATVDQTQAEPVERNERAEREPQSVPVATAEHPKHTATEEQPVFAPASAVAVRFDADGVAMTGVLVDKHSEPGFIWVAVDGVGQGEQKLPVEDVTLVGLRKVQ